MQSASTAASDGVRTSVQCVQHYYNTKHQRRCGALFAKRPPIAVRATVSPALPCTARTAITSAPSPAFFVDAAASTCRVSRSAAFAAGTGRAFAGAVANRSVVADSPAPGMKALQLATPSTRRPRRQPEVDKPPMLVRRARRSAKGAFGVMQDARRFPGMQQDGWSKARQGAVRRACSRRLTPGRKSGASSAPGTGGTAGPHVAAGDPEPRNRLLAMAGASSLDVKPEPDRGEAVSFAASFPFE